MGSNRARRGGEPSGKVKTTTLIVGLLVGLAFSFLIGITAGARGVGSIYPQMNLIAKPFVCTAGEMTHSQSISTGATATYYSAQWFCVNRESGERKEIDPTLVFVAAGIVYGLVFFAILLVIVYIYWNSRIGPAKNGGLRLW